MKQSGLADSPFFDKQKAGKKYPEIHDESIVPDDSVEEPELEINQPSIKSPNKSSMRSTNKEINTSRHHDNTISFVDDAMVDFIRASVKRFGKEATTHRFNQAEKRTLEEIVYSYRKRGLRTSENEIVRIAINFLLENYKNQGDSSLLSRCLDALHR